MQVLYVDDDAPLARTVALMLRRGGHSCVSADNGEQAVGLAKRDSYDIIVLDIMLPDIDGYEVARRVREAGVETPILIQSGLVDPDRRLEGLGIGPDEFLAKPFKRSELIERMTTLLARSRQGGYAPAVPRPDRCCRPQKVPNERRRHRRFLTYKYALVADGTERTACVVRDMSHSGADIQLLDPNRPCSPDFQLILQSGVSRRCAVR
ncbi:MAG: response regulator [Rhodospirillales bacterium]|nr:response regulator [Rhodospirillales bacterium]